MGKYVLRYFSCLGMMLASTSGFAGELGANNDEDAFLNLYFDEEQVVEASTRVAKPITQVAENVTIITAAEIERMNAHNLDDVLNRVAGVYVNFGGLDFNQSSYIYIQGSSWEHVVVLLDGIRLNKATEEVAWVNMIPVHIVKRIEVIKGAASSSWGSALGGVINIITKDTGETAKPKGDVMASYGKEKSREVAAELAGKASAVSYYLYGGNQDSDGIRNSRFYKNTSGYGKLRMDMPHDMRLEISGFYSRPEYRDSYWQDGDLDQELEDENTFLSARFDALLTPDLNFHAELFRFANDYRSVKHTVTQPVTLLEDFYNDQESMGGALRLDYQLGPHAVVAGVDYQRNEIQMAWNYRDGALWDAYYPALAPMGDSYTRDLLSENVSGYYLNGTFVFDNWTVTPGLRWDHVSTVDDDVASPSLGATYQLRADTLIRAAVSRGFRKPPVSHLEGDPLYNGPLMGNPDLEPETNWTYQAGLESTAIPSLHVKSTLFYHDIDNTWAWAPDWSIYRMNSGPSKRQGLELEVTTRSFFYTSLKTNLTYTHSHLPYGVKDDSYTANIILLFDHPDIITAELAGHYVNWGDALADGDQAVFNKAFLWDLSLNRSLYDWEGLAVSVYGVVHNVFNNDQYVSERWPNAPRWCELGLKLHF